MAGPGFLVAGRYRLRSKVGGGGMGAVWLAHDQLLDREVAVKQVVSTEGMTHTTADETRQRAMREGRIAARLGHRNAIAMHDVAVEDGEPWLVMEYLPSRSVAQILHAAGTLPAEQVAQIGAQVADAMAEAHDEGIVHRDIKPGNILIANSGRSAGLVKITDFGISRVDDEVQVTQSGVITGTPAYFAPEVARGTDPSAASDVYSLGATLYTMVEGQPPFGVDENSLVLLDRVARGVINPPICAGALAPILLRMLEPSPANRPTMAEARDTLARLAAGDGVSSEQVLSGRVTKIDGGTPTWVRRTATPQPGALGSYDRTAVPGPHHPGPHQPYPSHPYPLSGHPPQPSRSAVPVASAVFLGFLVLAVIALVLIAVLR
ncbi:Serine/threonine protein kinase [Williamsia sterculiae]|uniref:non-specific serine/threonine protein kinase n=1 Tax=Williamsia sterculiae TaxID=1344003 RepID=A0A1N7DVH4_9NOCA|nr:Serine/threonine protein kinase [Williamsia sterculiae]